MRVGGVVRSQFSFIYFLVPKYAPEGGREMMAACRAILIEEPYFMSEAVAHTCSWRRCIKVPKNVPLTKTIVSKTKK